MENKIMAKFNTVTIDKVTNDFGKFDRFRAVLNTGNHENHVTDIVEAKELNLIIEFITKNWSFAKIVEGRTI
ncbi:hypothetical protein [Salmonella phage vB_SenM-S16]|uniref:Uncharacterized protein n=1 Tax=Salmonella phage S16 TaxID=1087482 RepID=M1HEZ8_BPS16|nr:hypothetical protein I133_gp148 [Salmonella phage vB_SenM-S16]AGE48183.1 hypothetical protein [Salmonella phage vB_SenM-S16]